MSKTDKYAAPRKRAEALRDAMVRGIVAGLRGPAVVTLAVRARQALDPDLPIRVQFRSEPDRIQDWQGAWDVRRAGGADSRGNAILCLRRGSRRTITTADRVVEVLP